MASSPGVSAGTKGGTPWAQKSDKPEAGPEGAKSALDRLKSTASMKDMVDRTRVFLDCLDQLDSEGLAAAATWLAEQPGEGRVGGPGRFGDRMLETLLMNTWGKKDPEAALAWSKERGGLGNFTVLSAWAEIDPQKAAAWAVANPSENRGPRGRGGPGGGENENWNMLGVVSGALRGDPGAAVNLVQSMSEGRIRNQALDMVIDELYRTNPQDAKDLAAKMTDEAMKASVVERVANRMAREDPAQAIAYAMALPAGAAGRTQAIAEVVDEWAESDPDAAGQWLNQQPKSAETDEARRNYAMEIRRTDPEAAVAWANTITDDAQREQTVMRVALDWMRRDQEAAKAWVESQPNASEALKNMVNRPVPRWGGGAAPGAPGMPPRAGGRRGGGQ